MSRCNRCLLSFEESDAWQEFCSPECAMEYVCGRVMNADDESEGSRDWRKWTDWISDPRNARLVRNGSRAVAPEIGRAVVRTMTVYERGNGTKGREVTFRTNIGGAIEIRPMTEDERLHAIRMRGRDGFSDCHHYGNQNNLPSRDGKVGYGWFPHD